MPLPDNFSTVLKENKPPIDEGIYDAILEDVEFKPAQETPFGVKDQISFKFNLVDIDRVLFQTVNNSWSPPGKYKPSQYYTIGTSLGLPKVSTPPTSKQVNDLIQRPLKLVVKIVPKADGVTMKNKITDFVAIPGGKPAAPKSKIATATEVADEVPF